MDKRKKNIILILIIILVVLMALAIIFYIKQKERSGTIDSSSSTPVPFKIEFLTDTEKTVFNIKPEARVQVLKRAASGDVLVYKVIRNDSEIITDLGQIKTISPRTK